MVFGKNTENNNEVSITFVTRYCVTEKKGQSLKIKSWAMGSAHPPLNVLSLLSISKHWFLYLLRKFKNFLKKGEKKKKKQNQSKNNSKFFPKSVTFKVWRAMSFWYNSSIFFFSDSIFFWFFDFYLFIYLWIYLLVDWFMKWKLKKNILLQFSAYLVEEFEIVVEVVFFVGQ